MYRSTTLSSRYCLPDVLGDEPWRLFGGEKPGYRRVRASCDHVNGRLCFGYGSSGPLTTAADAYPAGWGVCRDFARVAISFCRALSIPSGPWRSALRWPAAAPSAWASRRVEAGGEGVEAGGEPFVAVVEPDVFAEGDQGGETVGWQ
jgi:transglutaminase-like putative cysteine protease